MSVIFTLLLTIVQNSNDRSCLALSTEDLQNLFSDDADKLEVGMKKGMLEELVKMLYFDYTVQIEVWYGGAC